MECGNTGGGQKGSCCDGFLLNSCIRVVTRRPGGKLYEHILPSLLELCSYPREIYPSCSVLNVAEFRIENMGICGRKIVPSFASVILFYVKHLNFEKYSPVFASLPTVPTSGPGSTSGSHPRSQTVPGMFKK